MLEELGIKAVCKKNADEMVKRENDLRSGA